MIDLKKLKPTKNQTVQFVVSGNAEKIKPLIAQYVCKKNGLSISITQLERPYL